MKILPHKQGSEQWKRARLGIPTASCFDALISPEGKPRTSQGRETYLLEKVAETILGREKNTGSTFGMDQGSLIESIARPAYEFQYDVKVQQVGLCTTDDGRVGASPDGLLGEDGGIEIKVPSAEVHLSYLLGGVVPKCYVAQVQGCLWVTQRKWWDFYSYSRFFPPLKIRVEPDPAFQSALGKALSAFLADYDAALKRVRDMMPAEPTGERASA